MLDIIAMTICAVVAGAEGWDDVGFRVHLILLDRDELCSLRFRYSSRVTTTMSCVLCCERNSPGSPTPSASTVYSANDCYSLRK